MRPFAWLAVAAALLAGCVSNASIPVIPGPTPSPSPSPLPTGTIAPTIYVANFGFPPSLSAFSSLIGGSGVAPVRIVAGAATGLTAPRAIAVDASGKIYVANLIGPASIEVFAAGAAGNVAPVQNILGDTTMPLRDVYALAIDGAGQIAVSNNPPDPTQHALLFFAPGSTGSVPPSRAITGGASVSTATGIAFDPAGELIAALQLPSIYPSNTLVAFAPGASGNATPVRIVNGSATQLDTSSVGGGAPALAAGQSGLYVAFPPTNALPARVLVFPLGANGNVAPSATIQGSATTLASPVGIAVDAAGYVFVLDASGQVAIFAPGATGNVAPLRTITGAGSSNPVAIAVGP
ncbi:MAG: hypothetical protein JO140_04370 [Candidatus Eremiobacteraeota bacterium]|nr:hypothetical protein [Candidatus Eremiobacteraeota bacterium]